MITVVAVVEVVEGAEVGEAGEVGRGAGAVRREVQREEARRAGLRQLRPREQLVVEVVGPLLRL